MSVPVQSTPFACLDSEVARQPLQIVVTAAGRENLMFRTLLKEVIPLLKNPHAYACAARMGLAEKIGVALTLDLDDNLIEEDTNPFLEDDYEPGSTPEWEEGWP